MQVKTRILLANLSHPNNTHNRQNTYYDKWRFQFIYSKFKQLLQLFQFFSLFIRSLVKDKHVRKFLFRIFLYYNQLI